MVYKRSCYVNGVYPLLEFLLMKTKIEREETFFFLGRAIPENIAKKFKNSWYLNTYFKKENKIKKYLKIYVLYRKLEKFLEKENLKNKEIYLQDNMTYSQFFLNHIEPCFLLEDGLANYEIKDDNLIVNKKKKSVKKIRDMYLKRCKNIYPIFGISEKIKKIYLTGIKTVPSVIKEKVEIIDIKEKWKILSTEEKKEILHIFDLRISELEKWESLKDKILLITQPLSEDGAIAEKEKIEIYSDIIKFYHYNNIIIKPHPREKTDYKMIFSEIEIITGKFPLEILMLLGINFKEVVTIFSTAALNFKGITNVNFLGTNDYENLKERFGSIEKIYYKI